MLLKKLTIKRFVPLLIFVFSFSVYISNLRVIGSGDTLPASLLPFSLVYYHNIYFDQFKSYFTSTGDVIYFFGEVRGHWISAYPIAMPIVLTPLYWLVLKFIDFDISNTTEVLNVGANLEKFAASFVTALSVAFIYLLLKKLTSKGNAFILTIIYAFATNTWASSSQALWQQGFSELTIVLALLTLLRVEDNFNYLFLTGLFSVLAVAERFNNFIFMLFLVGVVFFEYRRHFLKFVSLPIIIAVLFVSYNLYYYKSLIGGYSGSFLISNPIIGLFNLLLNPNRGILIYSPITIFSLFGLVYVLKNYKEQQKKDVYFIAIASFVGGLAFLSLWPAWWGGAVFGPRLMVDLVPFLIIFMVPVMDKIKQKQLTTKILFGALTILSIFIQIVGVYFYNGTDADYLRVRWLSYKYWKNTQIAKSIRSGPYLRPYVDFGVNLGLAKPLPKLEPSAYQAKIEIKKGYKNLKVVELEKYLVQVRNTSPFTWPKSLPSPITRSISLSYHWFKKDNDEPIAEGIRNYIIQPVKPGQTVNIDALVEAPPYAGEYGLQFGLIQEGITWFGDSKKINVKVAY